MADEERPSVHGHRHGPVAVGHPVRRLQQFDRGQGRGVRVERDPRSRRQSHRHGHPDGHRERGYGNRHGHRDGHPTGRRHPTVARKGGTHRGQVADAGMT